MKKMMMLTTTAYMSERFNRSNILILENMGYEVHVVANFDKGNPTTDDILKKFEEWIEEHHGKWFSIEVTKNPVDVRHNYTAYRQILNLIKEYKYEFIHCHTPVGGVLGRFSAHRTHTQVIYTAHGFHFFKGAPLKNWLLYYPVERFLSRWTNILILINQEDYQRAIKKFHANNVKYISGVGVDINKFITCNVNRNKLREAYGITPDDFAVISVGELNDNKNHETIIRAIAKIKNEQFKYIICGQGSLMSYLQDLSRCLEVEDQILFLGYRENVSELLGMCDLFVFPSKREGLGLAAIEAMASGLPLVTSNAGGIVDYMEDGKTGYMADANDVPAMADAILTLWKDKDMRNRMGKYNQKKAKKFDIGLVDEKMKVIYQFVS